jgi:hypothetical protein
MNNITEVLQSYQHSGIGQKRYWTYHSHFAAEEYPEIPEWGVALIIAAITIAVIMALIIVGVSATFF